MTELSKEQRKDMEQNQGSYWLDNQMVLNMVDSLETQLAQAKAELAKWEGAHGLDAERNAWKLKYENLLEDYPYAKERETLKLKAEKLAEALKYYSNPPTHNGEMVWSVGDAGRMAKEALAEYDELDTLGQDVGDK